MKNQYSQEAPNTVGNYFKAMKILFGAFILGIINFGIVIAIMFFLDMLPLSSFSEDYTVYLIFGNLAFLVIMIFIAERIFSSKMEEANKQTDLSSKLSVFRETKLIQILFLEGAGLLSMVLILINTHVAFVVCAAIALIQMVRYFPNKEKMIEVLNLSYSDQQKLNDPDYLLD